METLLLDTEKLLQYFLEMVRIDSPSGQESAMQAYLIQWCEDLGLSYQTDAGGNLIVEVPSNQCSHESVLALSGHMDVVPPCLGVQPVVEGTGLERVIYSDTTTVLGADDKAGLAAILEVLRFSLAENRPRPKLRLLFTTREEDQLGGAKDLSEEALQAQFAVTLDHTGPQGTIIHQAPSYYEFKIICRGKSVHAGIMPEKGVNAIMLASRIIERLHLGRIDEWTTANIGFIEGGKATNIVPDAVTLLGEIRGHQPDTLQAELRYIETVAQEESAKMAGASIEFSAAEEFRAYRLDPEHPGVQHVVAAARNTGLTPQLVYTNAGSDNNVFYHRGLPGVVLSAGYVEPHSLKERVQLSEMLRCSEFLLNILEQFAAHAF